MLHSLKPKTPKKNMLINGKYILGEKLGSGSFGDVYYVYDNTEKIAYAAKLENTKVKFQQLPDEAKILKMLQNKDCFPKLIWYGTQDGYNILIMDLLGSNLEDLFTLMKRKFSIKTIANLAIRIPFGIAPKHEICIIEHLHNLSYIHRDIKPENFMIGQNPNTGKIYMIDFGLSKSFRDSKTSNHLRYTEKKSLVGTARYASINAHMGMEQSRRDDLESIGYLLIYFFKGSLPWQNIKVATREEKYKKIMERKMSISTDTLCKDLPIEIAIYLNYCKQLAFSDLPDYTYIKKLFKDILHRYYHSNEDKNEFDWIINQKFIKAVEKKSNIYRTLSYLGKNQGDIHQQEVNEFNKKYLSNQDSIQENINVRSIPFKNVSKKNYGIMNPVISFNMNINKANKEIIEGDIKSITGNNDEKDLDNQNLEENHSIHENYKNLLIQTQKNKNHPSVLSEKIHITPNEKSPYRFSCETDRNPRIETSGINSVFLSKYVPILNDGSNEKYYDLKNIENAESIYDCLMSTDKINKIQLNSANMNNGNNQQDACLKSTNEAISKCTLSKQQSINKKHNHSVKSLPVSMNNISKFSKDPQEQPYTNSKCDITNNNQYSQLIQVYGGDISQRDNSISIIQNNQLDSKDNHAEEYDKCNNNKIEKDKLLILPLAREYKDQDSNHFIELIKNNQTPKFNNTQFYTNHDLFIEEKRGKCQVF